MSTNLSKSTIDFYKNADLEKRKKEGQYMTPYNIIQKSINQLNLTNINNIKVLEPSYGTGQFIDLLLNSGFTNIYGIEKDKELFELSKQQYSSLNIFNDDYLTKQFDTKFDLIIGNPPYFEFTPSKELKKIFKNVIIGRVNIYTLFVKKAIDELNYNGILSFVIPTALLSSSSFSLVRKYILANCNILYIEKLNSNDFSDALQQTMIFQCIKKNNNLSDDKYLVKFNNDNILFSPDYIELNKYILNKKTIAELGCVVKTGNIVWNQIKELLTNNEKDSTPLIYARNINTGKLIFENKQDSKKQYILNKCNKDKIKPPLIAINRIIGSKNISLNPVLITDKEYYYENHVNVITGPIDILKNILIALNNKDTFNFISKISGNTQLSKNELESFVPI